LKVSGEVRTPRTALEWNGNLRQTPDSSAASPLSSSSSVGGTFHTWH